MNNNRWQMFQGLISIIEEQDNREFFNNRMIIIDNGNQQRDMNTLKQSHIQSSKVYDFYYLENFKYKHKDKEFLFITITTDPIANFENDFDTQEEKAIENVMKQLDEMIESFNRFRQRTRRIELEFVKVIEMMKKGNAHLHILIATNDVEKILFYIKRLHQDKEIIGRLHILMLRKDIKAKIKRKSFNIIEHKDKNIILDNVEIKQDIEEIFKKGNYCFVEFIDSEENEVDYIFNYMMKYIKKGNETMEHKLINAFGYKKITYSRNDAQQIFHYYFRDWERLEKRDLMTIISKISYWLKNPTKKEEFQKYLKIFEPHINEGKPLLEIIFELLQDKSIYKKPICELNREQEEVKIEVVGWNIYFKDIILKKGNSEIIDIEKEFDKDEHEATRQIIELFNSKNQEERDKNLIVLFNIVFDLELNVDEIYEEYQFLEEERKAKIEEGQERLFESGITATEEEKKIFNDLW